MLPHDPDPTRELGPRARFRTHAYIVLACALIEEFLETCFREHLIQALQRVQSTVADPFLFLATHFSGDVIGQGMVHAPASDVCRALHGLYSSKVVEPNNGIKRKNLRALAKPLGLQMQLEDKCDALLQTADTLGAKRGSLAHASAVTTEVRPGEASRLVSDVLAAIPSMQTLLGVP